MAVCLHQVALCAALRSSVEALQEEKEGLQEELRQHRALGAGLEALVQDHCRPNEREKYRVFTGTGAAAPARSGAPTNISLVVF